MRARETTSVMTTRGHEVHWSRVAATQAVATGSVARAATFAKETKRSNSEASARTPRQAGCVVAGCPAALVRMVEVLPVTIQHVDVRGDESAVAVRRLLG